MTSGEYTLGHNAEVDYFAQDQYKQLDVNARLFDDIRDAAPRATETELRNLLGCFLFSEDDVFKRIGVLSGGERNRYALARMLLRPSNFLLLDEPTNHLDIRAKDVLLEALKSFTGTLVFVSHDRYFLEHLATRVFEIGEGEVRVFPGNYADYLWRKEGGPAQTPAPLQRRFDRSPSCRTDRNAEGGTRQASKPHQAETDAGRGGWTGGAHRTAGGGYSELGTGAIGFCQCSGSNAVIESDRIPARGVREGDAGLGSSDRADRSYSIAERSPSTVTISSLRRILSFLACMSLVCCWVRAANKTQNVIFVMTDGLRWQEVFSGADASLIDKDAGGVEDVAATKSKYWRGSASERRTALMPFVWSHIAVKGQIYGDPDLGSPMSVTNGLNFSYPGYSEALTGVADPRVNSNDKVPNPNVSVLEWLNDRPAYHDKMAAFAAWDAFPWILNVKRSHLLVSAGWEPFDLLPGNIRVGLLNTLKHDGPRYWDDEPFDSIPFYTAIEYLKAEHPRVLFVSLGETDDWAHGKRYDLYLDAAHRADQYVRELWEAVQGMPEYRDKTTLVFATDHGRGMGSEWTTHGEKAPASKNVWLMIMGPDTPRKGELRHTPVYQNQIASTVAATLGEDYAGQVPGVGKPIEPALKEPAQK